MYSSHERRAKKQRKCKYELIGLLKKIYYQDINNAATFKLSCKNPEAQVSAWDETEDLGTQIYQAMIALENHYKNSI
jgi:hypothetical protein